MEVYLLVRAIYEIAQQWVHVPATITWTPLPMVLVAKLGTPLGLMFRRIRGVSSNSSDCWRPCLAGTARAVGTGVKYKANKHHHQ